MFGNVRQWAGPLVMLALAASAVGAQETTRPRDPQVDEAAVLRLGNMVQHIDGSYRASPEDAYVEAMAPPQSDAEKWFISVISMRNCPACERLKRDWRTNRWLQALARPDDEKNSWAHFNVYWRGDESQMWRFENITIGGYPTILVQPPRTGTYGDPTTVVFQGTGYDGDGKKLATRITKAIRKYIGTLPNVPRGAWHEVLGGDGQAAVQPENIVGIDPPWTPAPLDEENLLPISPSPNGGPLIPPIFDEPKPVFSVPWMEIALGVAALCLIPPVIIAVLWLIYRIVRRLIDRKPPWDDKLLDSLLDRLRDEIDKSPQTAPKAATRRRPAKKTTRKKAAK